MNLFEESLPGGAINAVSSKELVWVKLPVAVDSGACAHVTPANVFGLTTEPTAESKAGQKWYGAEGSGILNLGLQKVSGQDENGNPISVRFNVASKLTRPLMSVWEMTENGNDVGFSKGRGWVTAASGHTTELRAEGKLWSSTCGSKFLRN